MISLNFLRELIKKQDFMVCSVVRGGNSFRFIMTFHMCRIKVYIEISIYDVGKCLFSRDPEFQFFDGATYTMSAYK